MPELTHFNESGEAHMVDVGEKQETHRIARAGGRIYMNREALLAVKEGTAGKGDVLGVARIAGIMGAKSNAQLIPLCHIVPLTKCGVEFALCEEECCIDAVCTAECIARTGVEMEALTGVSIALLTVYDMLKAVDRSMHIEEIRLLEKDGGRSGHYIRKDE